MFFEREGVSFEILDVMELAQTNVNMLNRARRFSAVSLRIRADAVLSTEKEEHHLGDGAVAFVPAGLEYRRAAAVDRLIVVNFDLLGPPSERIETFVTAHPERLEALFRRILRVWQEKESGYRYEAAALFSEILLACYRENRRGGERSSTIRASVEYLHRCYTDPKLTVAAIAARSYMSEVYFRRLFKAEYGVSPLRYIVSLRIRHAAALLTSGYHTLSEVAYLSGYTDYKYFTASFKREMGVSPSQYRDTV